MLKINSKYQMPGFPCQFHTFLKTSNKPTMYHYIDQRILIQLLARLKFKIIFEKIQNNKAGASFIVAQKLD